MADLAQVMIPYLPEDSLHQLYELILPLIGSLQPQPQKKAYQILFHLISSNEPVCVGFVGCHVAEIAQSLAESSSCVCSGSRRVSRLILPLPHLYSHTHTHTHTHMHAHAHTHLCTHTHTCTPTFTHLSSTSPFTQPRLQCLTAMVDQLSSDQNDFLTAVLPEAVLGMKETNERARCLACDLIVKMGYASHRCSQLSPQGVCL